MAEKKPEDKFWGLQGKLSQGASKATEMGADTVKKWWNSSRKASEEESNKKNKINEKLGEIDSVSQEKFEELAKKDSTASQSLLRRGLGFAHNSPQSLSGENMAYFSNFIFGMLLAASMFFLTLFSGGTGLIWGAILAVTVIISALMNFPIFLLIAGSAYIMLSGVLAAEQGFMIMVFIFGGLMGISSPPSARPYVGTLVTVSLLVFLSFYQTGLVGQAVFGDLWPSVEAQVVTVLEPIGQSMTMATSTLGDMSLFITCPSCYYQQEAERQRAQSQVTSGGSVRALESSMELLGGLNEIDPAEPLIGSIEVTNKGEFGGSDLVIRLGELEIIDPSETSLVEGQADGWNTGITGIFNSCGGGTQTTNGCEFDEAIFPDDSRYMTFRYNDTTNRLSNIEKCMCYNEDKGAHEDCELNTDIGTDKITVWRIERGDLPLPDLIDPYGLTCEGCSCGTNKTYLLGGYSVVIPFTYEFKYSANVSLPVDIMNSELLTQKLQDKSIKLEQKTSEYHGGPVKISIWTQKQPLRDGETSFGQFSLLNEGTGTITSGIAKLYVQNETGELIKFDEISDAMSCAPVDSDIGGYTMINCTNIGSIAPGGLVTYKFEFTYNKGTLDTFSTIFIGSAEYTYEIEDTKTVPIVPGPL